MQVPNDKLYGAQTARSLTNFKIGTERMPKEIIRAFGIFKKSRQWPINRSVFGHQSGELDHQASDEVIKGDFDAHFPLVVWQTGSGTQTNMNVNEVIANRANILAGSPMGSGRRFIPTTM